MPIESVICRCRCVFAIRTISPATAVLIFYSCSMFGNDVATTSHPGPQFDWLAMSLTSATSDIGRDAAEHVVLFTLVPAKLFAQQSATNQSNRAKSIREHSKRHLQRAISVFISYLTLVK